MSSECGRAADPVPRWLGVVLIRIDADPAGDRLHPVSGCSMLPEPETDVDREFEDALADFYETRDELEEQRSRGPAQERLY